MITPPALDLILEFSRRDGADQPHEFHFAPQTYHLRNPGGHIDAAELPWTHDLLADLAALRGASPDAAVAFRVGAVLQRFLERTSWAAHEPRIIDASRAGAAISITIRSAAAELYGLPWELLTLRGSQQMLGGVPGLVVRYEWPGSTTAPDTVPANARRGRVLFAWSAAGGAVPAADHLAALRAHVRGFDPARDVVAHASFAAIAEALERAATIGPPVDVLHLLCHGAATGASYGLALDGDGHPVVVDAGRMQQLLVPHAGMLRTVLVAACDSGDAVGAASHLGSIAQMIHRAGLPAVIASRFPLSAAGSTKFVTAFHAASASKPLAQAFVAARDALVRDPSLFDWASVQLYARADDPTPPALVAPPTPITPALPDTPRRRPTLLAAAAAVGALAIAALVIPPLLAGPAAPPVTAPPTTTPTPAPVVTPPPLPPEPAKQAEPAKQPEPARPTEPAKQPESKQPVPKTTPIPSKRTPKPAESPDEPPDCEPGVEGFLRANLGEQPRLSVEISATGKIKAIPKNDADFEGSADARKRVTQLPDPQQYKLPCKLLLVRKRP